MQISHDELLTGLTLAERAVHEYARFPDQSGVRLVTQGNGLQLIALHAEGGTSVFVSAQIDEPLDVVIPARALLDLVNTAPRGEVIHLRGLPRQRLSVNWARNTATLAGYEPKAGYSEPSDDAQPLIAISVDDLRCALQQVSFATSHDQARPLLTGILLEASNDQATFAATNGFHLMMRIVPVQINTPVRLTLPGKFCRDLLYALSVVESDEDRLTLTLSANKTVIVHYGPSMLWSSLLEGTYPDTAAFVKQARQGSPSAVVPQGTLARMGKSVSIIHHSQAALQLRPNLLALYASDSESGDTHPVTDAECATTFTGFFSPKLLNPAIKSMPRGDLEIRVTEPLKPIALTPKLNTDTLYLLMPVYGAGLQVPEPVVDLFTGKGAAMGQADETELSEITDTDLFAIARASYSGDRIREGRIKKPFLWKGEPYVCHSLFGNRKAECVQLVPRAQWQGEVTNKVNGNGYAGVGVAYSKTQYVMTDVRLTVIPEPEGD